MRRSEKSELFYGYRPVGYPQKLVVAHQRPDGSVACLRISQDVRLEKGNKLGVELHVMSLVKAEQPDPDSGRAKMSMGKAEQAGSDGGRAKIVIRPEPGLRVALTEFDQLDLRGVYDVRNVRISAVRIGRVVEESMGSLKEYYAEVVLGPMGADFIRYQGSSGQRSRT